MALGHVIRFLGWQPAAKSAAYDPAAHRASLEARWKSGYMNPKQIYESLKASGGHLKLA